MCFSNFTEVSETKIGHLTPKVKRKNTLDLIVAYFVDIEVELKLVLCAQLLFVLLIVGKKFDFRPLTSFNTSCTRLEISS